MTYVDLVKATFLPGQLDEGTDGEEQRGAATRLEDEPLLGDEHAALAGIQKQGKEMFYLTTYSTHFIYSYMASGTKTKSHP